jgi:hypothetical protein
MDRLIECITATNFGLSIGFPYHVNRNKAAIEPSTGTGSVIRAA